MARKWFGLVKAMEEPAELIVELCKLQAFPDGKHPGRRRSVILSAEDEIADVEAALEYFKKRNKLDIDRMNRRKKTKIKKFEKWWGPLNKKSKPKPKIKKSAKK